MHIFELNKILLFSPADIFYIFILCFQNRKILIIATHIFLAGTNVAENITFLIPADAEIRY